MEKAAGPFKGLAKLGLNAIGRSAYNWNVAPVTRDVAGRALKWTKPVGARINSSGKLTGYRPAEGSSAISKAVGSIYNAGRRMDVGLRNMKRTGIRDLNSALRGSGTVANWAFKPLPYIGGGAAVAGGIGYNSTLNNINQYNPWNYIGEAWNYTPEGLIFNSESVAKPQEAIAEKALTPVFTYGMENYPEQTQKVIDFLSPPAAENGINKESSMQKKANRYTSFAKLFAGSIGRTSHDWLVKPWENVAAYGLRKISPAKGGGAVFSKRDGRLLSYTPTEGHTFSNFLGGIYNGSRRLRHGLNRWESKAVNDLNKVNPNLGNYTKRGLGIASTAGMTGVMGQAVMDTAGWQDNPVYKTLDVANTLNPYGLLYGHDKSPLLWAWEHGTPLGLGASAAMSAVENIGTSAAQAGAANAINSTADALGNMSFADRLGFLFAPAQAASTYKSKAFDELARAMANAKASGGEASDKALADIYNTVG